MDWVTKKEFQVANEKLWAAVTRLASDQVRMREEMATKQDIRSLREDIQRLHHVVVDSVQKGRAYFEKALSHGGILQEHEAKLRDYGRRITRVERRAA